MNEEGKKKQAPLICLLHLSILKQADTVQQLDV